MAARPPPAPPARALLLALAGALLAPRAARGVNLEHQLVPSMQQAGTSNGGGTYEVASVSLLNGDPWNLMKNADSENHPGALSLRIQLTSKELIVNLERNEQCPLPPAPRLVLPQHPAVEGPLP